MEYQKPDNKTETEIKEWLAKSTEMLPTETPKDKFKRHKLSEEAKTILENRQAAINDRNIYRLVYKSRRSIN